MTNFRVNTKDEFSIDGMNVYKITKMLNTDGDKLRFLAIYIGTYCYRETTTYNGYMKHGDFTLDNALFEVDQQSGQITKVHDETGIIGLPTATDEYLKAVDRM
jgi:hypothetical protein